MKLRWLLTNNVGNKNPNFRVFLPPSSYNDDICKNLGLTTLETKRLRGDLMKVFTIFKGYDDICKDIFLLEQNPT